MSSSPPSISSQSVDLTDTSLNNTSSLVCDYPSFILLFFPCILPDHFEPLLPSSVLRPEFVSPSFISFFTPILPFFGGIFFNGAENSHNTIVVCICFHIHIIVVGVWEVDPSTSHCSVLKILLLQLQSLVCVCVCDSHKPTVLFTDIGDINS